MCKMHLFVLFLVISSAICGDAEIVQEDLNKPRLFFRQMIEASGLLPIEINVPDTLSSIWSGMNYMYQATSSYFGGGNEGEGEGAGDQSQVVYDHVDENLKPINGKHRRKKVKKLKKKTNTADDDDDELNVFDLFNFLMF